MIKVALTNLKRLSQRRVPVYFAKNFPPFNKDLYHETTFQSDPSWWAAPLKQREAILCEPLLERDSYLPVHLLSFVIYSHGQHTMPWRYSFSAQSGKRVAKHRPISHR
jgi:hypothetical protein